ncbi:unnamed protein product [Adineta steineri]|uniref:Cas1p 10 TM acyl transferase domain-containing protein n=1 Tax=Adineta steineri TaxID=433720 RepID=A0A818S3W3_9BILA|nr:unnamed protein product [Adineta steineri]CAF3663086.1 unnamed protein product [Adineta steineri]
MSSKHGNPTNNNNNNTNDISIDNTINNNLNQKSTSCAVGNRLSSSHHVRHHSYDTTSNKLATQIFPPSRLNRKETNTNENPQTQISQSHSSHRHTSSYAASDRSSFTNLNSNYYHQHNYSASQENLRHSDINPSSFTTIPLKYPITPTIPSSIPITTATTTTTSTSTTTTISTAGATTSNSLPSSLSHLNNNSSSSSSTILNRFNIHNAKLIGLLFFFVLLFYHGSLRYIKGATSCHRLLNEGRIERYHVWQPTGCMIHWYDLLDFNQCTRLITQSSSTIDKSLIATRKAFNNRIDPGEWLRTRKQEQQRLKQEKQDKTKINFSYTFIGDERLYMIYRTFINTIKYHSNLSRKKPSTIIREKDQLKQQHKQYPFIYKHAKNLTYTNENFILQYYSIQTFNDYLYNLLYSWTTNSSLRPHVLIIGLGLYDGLRDNASLDTMKYFEGNLTRIKNSLLTNLSLTTTIFWFGQPHLSLNEHLFRLPQHSLNQQNEYINEFIPKINSYIDRMNSIAKNIFYHTNIYWHSSTLLEEYSSISNENIFLYDDNNDEYFIYNDNNNDDDDDVVVVNDLTTNDNEHDDLIQSSSTTITTTIIPNLSSLLYVDFDDYSINQTEIIYYSYIPLRKNHTILTTSMINSGKIYEFYKLSSFTRHTCVQILLNALCNPLLLPDDGTCCAQVPPLTRLQFLISLVLGCSITIFIIYIVYRVRSVFILKRKSHIILDYNKQNHHHDDEQQTQQHKDNHQIANGHCHINGAFNKDVNEDGDEADQQLLAPTMNGDCSSNYSRSNNCNSILNQNHSSSLSTGLNRFRFLIPKFLRNLRKKSCEHLLPPLLLTTSIATQSSPSSSNNENNNNTSSYPSRFYKKQNSLLHFPFTEPKVLRTSVKYAFILLYFYLADRTDFLMKENSHFSRIAFFLPLTYIGVLGIFFHDKYFNKTTSNRSSPNQTPITTSPNITSKSIFSSIHNNDYEQIQSHSDSNDENNSLSINENNNNNNDNNNSFLNKEQINEMRGWMMVILLAYQMTDASGKSLVLSMSIQLLISAYLFLSAYSHFHYYWTTGNYQFLPFIRMLFKYNFLTITLCLLMNRHYQSYYYPPLITFYFSLMYFILACIPPRISASSVKEKPIHFIYLLLKFLLMGILVTVLSMSAYVFEKIFTFHLWNNLFTTSTITSSLAAYVQQLDQSDLSYNGLHQLHSLLIHDKSSLYYNEYNTLLDYISGSGQGIVGPVSMNGISLNDKQYLYSNLYRYNANSSTHLYYDRNGTINDWYHRWNLDRYTVLYGMCFAFLILFIENYDTYRTLGIKRKQYQQLTAKLKTIFCLLSLLGLIIYFIVLFLCSNKAICDEIHPYIVILPIISYILLRNIPTFIRQHYSPFFAWFGKISLELFVAQYHIWLIANGHGTLTVIPRMPTLNLIITTFIFVCCCHELHRITNILTPVFVPKDCKCFIRNCLLYLLIIIVSSYMFSSV